MMMKVAAIILHGFAVFMAGMFGAIWFSSGGYGSIAWLGFVFGGLAYVAAVAMVAVVWEIIVGSEVMKGEN